MDTSATARRLLATGTEASIEAAFRTGEYEAAEATLGEALELAQADGDRAAEAGALNQLGWLVHFKTLEMDPPGSDFAEEESLFQRALDIRRELADLAGVAASLFGVGMVRQVLQRDWKAAMPCYLEAMTLAEDYGDALLRSEVHRHVGFFYMVHDVQPEKALHHLRISQELRLQWGDQRWIPSGTVALGVAELVAGRRGAAISQLRLAVRQAREEGLSQRHVEFAEQWLRRAESGEEPIFR